MASYNDQASASFQAMSKSNSLREQELANNQNDANRVREDIRRLSQELSDLKSELELKKTKLNQVNNEVTKIATNIKQFPYSMSRSKSLPEKNSFSTAPTL